MPSNNFVLSPSDFVAILNQTLEFAYPFVTIEGEIAHFRVSKNKWVYFDIKDDQASVKCFATIYQLGSAFEDGMKVKIVAQPRLHPLYNFSLTVQTMSPVGEGSIKRAADLLREKLAKEGLFDEARKRLIPFAPQEIVLIASRESAAYADFVKIVNERWVGVLVHHIDVQVQGEQAIGDIVRAIELANLHIASAEVIVVTRGGGSADDLAAFSSEPVTRSVAMSRIPTLVAIGHEVDFSLAELAADRRASTPSNAAQILVPDRLQVRASIKLQANHLLSLTNGLLTQEKQYLQHASKQLDARLFEIHTRLKQYLGQQQLFLEMLSPMAALKRGYAVVKRVTNGSTIRSIKQVHSAELIQILLSDGTFEAIVKKVQ